MRARTPESARRASSIYFVGAIVLGALWTAARIVPDDAADGLLVASGLLLGPSFAAMLVCMALAFRHRGWADGFEAARSQDRGGTP